MSVLPAGFRKSTLSNYANTVSSLLLALVTVPLLTHGLGRTGYGIWVLVGSLVLYLELFEFGFGASTIRYVADAAARADDAGVRTAIVTSFWLLVVPGMGALTVGGAIAAAFPHFFAAGAQAHAARIIVLLLAVDLALSIPGDTFGGVLIALQRWDLLNLTLICVSVLQTVAIAVVLLVGGRLIALAVATVTISLAGQLARYLMCRRLVPGLSLHPRRARRELIAPYASTSVWFGLNQLSNVVVQRLDAVVVGGIVGVGAAGVYAVGQKLALLGERLVQPATGAFFPHAATQAASGDARAVADSSMAACRFAAAVALPPSLILALLARPALDAWVGPRFADGVNVVVYLAAAGAISSIRRPAQSILGGLGKPKVVAVINICEAVTNLTLSVILARRMGLSGVALATLITNALATVGFVMPYFCRTVLVPQRSLYGRLVRSHALPAGLVTVLALGLLSQHPRSVVPVVGGAALLGMVYLVTLAFTGLSAQERAAAMSFRARRTAPADPIPPREPTETTAQFSPP